MKKPKRTSEQLRRIRRAIGNHAMIIHTRQCLPWIQRRQASSARCAAHTKRNLTGALVMATTPGSQQRLTFCAVNASKKSHGISVDGDNQHVMLITCTCCPTACTCLCDMSMEFLAESNTHPASDGQTACKN